MNPNEKLAEALYGEWAKKVAPYFVVLTWEDIKASPFYFSAWLAVADMAVLNLCGPSPEQMREIFADPTHADWK